MSMARRLPWCFWSIRDDAELTIAQSRGRGLRRFGLDPGELEGCSYRDAFPESSVDEAMSTCREGAIHTQALSLDGYPKDVFLTFSSPWLRRRDFVGIHVITIILPKRVLAFGNVRFGRPSPRITGFACHVPKSAPSGLEDSDE